MTNGFPRMWSQMLQESRMLVFPFWGNCFKGSTFSVVPFHFFHLNGNIFVDSPSIRRRNPTWKVLRDFIDFEKQIHVEIMTSIQRDFDVVSTFKIYEISMSSPPGFINVVLRSNWCNCCITVSILSFPNIFCFGNLF